MIFAVVVTLLGALTTARLTRLISADRVMLPFRRAIAARFGPSHALAYLVNCRWCVSIYVAPPVAAAVIWLVPRYQLHRWLYPGAQGWAATVVAGALLALAFSHVTALLAGLEDED